MKHIKELKLNESNSSGKLDFGGLLRNQWFKDIRISSGFNENAFELFKDQRFLTNDIVGKGLSYIVSNNGINVYGPQTQISTKFLMILGYALGADSVSEESDDEEFYVRWWWD